MYTFQVRTTPVDPAQEDNFANMQRDASRSPLNVSNGIQTQDVTGTAVTSPVTLATNAVTTINIPVNAITMTITSKSFSTLFSEAIANASLSSWSANYAEVPVGTSVTIGVAKQSVIYLLGGTGAAITSFFFGIV